MQNVLGMPESISERITREAQERRHVWNERYILTYNWFMSCLQRIPESHRDGERIVIALPLAIRASLASYAYQQVDRSFGGFCAGGMLEQESHGHVFRVHGYRIVPGYEPAFVAFSHYEPNYFKLKIDIPEANFEKMTGYTYLGAENPINIQY